MRERCGEGEGGREKERENKTEKRLGVDFGGTGVQKIGAKSKTKFGLIILVSLYSDNDRVL